MASRKNAVNTTMRNRSANTKSVASAPAIHAANAAPSTGRNATVEGKPAPVQIASRQAVAEAPCGLVATGARARRYETGSTVVTSPGPRSVRTTCSDGFTACAANGANPATAIRCSSTRGV